MYTSAKPYFYGTGRRKKSVARVRLYPGTGMITVNGKDISSVEFSTQELQTGDVLVITLKDSSKVQG